MERFKYKYVLLNNNMKKTIVKDNKIKVTLSLSPEVINNFKNYCKKRGMKVSSKVELMIKDELSREI